MTLRDAIAGYQSEFATLLELADWPGIITALRTVRSGILVREQPIPRRDIKQAMLAKLPGILTSESPAAAPVKLLFADPDFSTINTQSPVWLALLGGLKEAGLISQDDIDAVDALGTRHGSILEQWKGIGATVTEDEARSTLS